METISALGHCKKCGRQMVRVDDVNKCFRCESNAQISSGPTVLTEDPGDEKLSKFLKNQKIPVESLDTVKQVVQKVHGGSTIHDALKIMKSLSLPEDIKQFKQIKKIITLMEQLISKE
jgi:hypothetical protein